MLFVPFPRRTFVPLFLALGLLAAGSAPARSQTVGPNEMAVHYINVDQGAAALLEFSCGAILIDGGGVNARDRDHLTGYIRAFLSRRRDLRNRLAAVFVTHAHIDHDRYLGNVAAQFYANSLIFNGTSTSRTTRFASRARALDRRFVQRTITNVEMGNELSITNNVIDPVNCPGTDPVITVLSGGQPDTIDWPRRDYNNKNNHSLVIRVDFDQASFLFTGDLEEAGIAHLLRRMQGTELLDVDVYTVGHHGAENGTTADFLRQMTPQIAVISAGNPRQTTAGMTAWDHGHPRTWLLELLDERVTGARTPVDILGFEGQEVPPTPHTERRAVYSTSRDGDIIVRARANGQFEVETSR